MLAALQGGVDLGRIASLEKEHKPVDTARKGDAVAMKIEVGLLSGRQRCVRPWLGGVFGTAPGRAAPACCCSATRLPACCSTRALRSWPQGGHPLLSFTFPFGSPSSGHQAGGGLSLVRAPL
jgi:hypothetical protein